VGGEEAEDVDWILSRGTAGTFDLFGGLAGLKVALGDGEGIG